MLLAEIADVSGVLGVVEGVMSFLIKQIGTLVELVMSQPLLLIPIGITLTFTVIRVFRTIFRLV